ncbi:MAG: glycosyltransferase family 2 protein [Pyrinomonadaceae bacterium]
MPKVSVVIPCFNLGKYIHEAIDSVMAQTFQDFEITVVNDGSTDIETNLILESLDNSKIKVIKTDNQGLAAARNNGIAQAAGKYILPLDADDKIADTYLEKAVSILDENENVGIVYCRAEFFDRENFKWDLPKYELSRILIDNLIFCSAFFRKTDWETVGGYKSSMIYGWEDYEFWLSIIELKREVYQIPEHLFFYRQRSDSMANIMSREHLFYSHKEIVKNHKNLYLDNIEHIYKYIYSLRDIITEQQQYQSVRDGEIHNLNSEISNLNKQLSSARGLIRLLIKSIAKKIGF